MKVYKIRFIIFRVTALFTFSGLLILMSLGENPIDDYLIIVVLLLFCLTMWLFSKQTSIILENEKLIKDYFFFKRSILISEISSVRLVSALYADRLEVRNKDGKRFLYDANLFFQVDSDLKDFILELRKVNPLIKTNFEDKLNNN